MHPGTSKSIMIPACLFAISPNPEYIISNLCQVGPRLRHDYETILDISATLSQSISIPWAGGQGWEIEDTLVRTDI